LFFYTGYLLSEIHASKYHKRLIIIGYDYPSILEFLQGDQTRNLKNQSLLNINFFKISVHELNGIFFVEPGKIVIKIRYLTCKILLVLTQDFIC